MKPSSGKSLRQRLSQWLAALTFLVFAAVSSAIYVLIEHDLYTRQNEAMAQKAQTVKHLLEEALKDNDIVNLQHRFTDFFMGHTELSLVLTDASGAAWYESRTAVTPGDALRERSFQFDLKGEFGKAAPITAKLSLNIDTDRKLLRQLVLYLISSTLLCTLLVMLGASILTRLALVPIGILVRKTQILDADRLHERLDTTNQPSELLPLISQFNQLLGRLEQAHEQQEGFNADVAHELNTPLSTLVTSAELALRKNHDESMLRDTLSSSLEELHRLSAIVKDMLFLSNAQRSGAARRIDVTSLAAIASEVAEYHEAAMTESGLSIAIHGDADGNLDASLIKRAISNLLDNARRYAIHGGTIRIEIAWENNSVIRLAVTNEGKPVATSELVRIFDRFYRADTSRTHAEIHHGLGLSIVAAIARMHGGKPFAMSKGDHTTVGMLLLARPNEENSTRYPHLQ